MIKFNEVTWYSKLLAAIIFLLGIPGLTFYFGTRVGELKEPLIVTTILVKSVDSRDEASGYFSMEGKIKNSTIDGHKYEDGFKYDECVNATVCNYPDERFSTVVTPFLIEDLNRDGVDEIFVSTASAAGNNYGTPIILQLKETGPNSYETVNSFPLEEKGELSVGSADDTQIVIDIDTAWKGGGIVSQTINFVEQEVIRLDANGSYEGNGLKLNVVSQNTPGLYKPPLEIGGIVTNVKEWKVFEGEAGVAKLFGIVNGQETEIASEIISLTDFSYDESTHEFILLIGDRQWISNLDSEEGYIWLRDNVAKDGEIANEIKISITYDIPGN